MTEAIAECLEDLSEPLQSTAFNTGEGNEHLGNLARGQKALVYNQLTHLARVGAGRGFNVKEEKQYTRVVESLTDEFNKDIESEDCLSDGEHSEIEPKEDGGNGDNGGASKSS